MHKVFGALSFCLTMGAFLCAFAQQIDLEALAKRPGFTVTKKVVNGKETVEIRKASVVITMDSQGMMGMDRDTAILCAWHIYVDIKLASDFCFPDDKHELKRDLTDAVERLKDFIVANSLVPVDRSQLDASIQQRRTENFSTLPKSLVGTDQCPMSSFLIYFEESGHEKRKRDLDKMLAVPRPPVMNPCL